MLRIGRLVFLLMLRSIFGFAQVIQSVSYQKLTVSSHTSGKYVFFVDEFSEIPCFIVPLFVKDALNRTIVTNITVPND